MNSLKQKLEAWAEDWNDSLFDEAYVDGLRSGAREMLALLRPVIETQIEFNRKFSPGENWYPESSPSWRRS